MDTEWSNIPWGNGLVGTSAQNDAIGKGKSNTEAIVSAYGAGGYAARLCYDLITNYNSYTFDDWFMPSKMELQAIKDAGLSGFTDQYWSSTEVDADNACDFFFNGNQHNINLKTSQLSVRAVRAF